MATLYTRGDVVAVNLDPTVGTEIKKTRPCVIVQNNLGNQYSTRLIIVPATDAEHVKKAMPIFVRVTKGEGGLTKDSVILCDQVRAVDKTRIVRTFGRLSSAALEKVDEALRISLAL